MSITPRVWRNFARTGRQTYSPGIVTFSRPISSSPSFASGTTLSKPYINQIGRFRKGNRPHSSNRSSQTASHRERDCSRERCLSSFIFPSPAWVEIVGRTGTLDRKFPGNVTELASVGMTVAITISYEMKQSGSEIKHAFMPSTFNPASIRIISIREIKSIGACSPYPAQQFPLDQYSPGRNPMRLE